MVCLQETKLADDAFLELLGDELAGRGYAVAVHGEAAWNGVAILSRVGLDDVAPGSPAAPGFPHPEARAIAATCGGIRVISVYVPNGREPDSDHYRYKLAWLAALRDVVAAGPGGDDRLRRHEHRADRRRRLRPGRLRRPDARDPAGARGAGRAGGARPARRRARPLAERAGLHATGTTAPGCSTRTWGCGSTWSWPARRSRRASARPGSTVRRARASGPSDHAPVIVDLDEAPDGDIGPVVPPPSAPVPGAARRSCRSRREGSVRELDVAILEARDDREDAERLDVGAERREPDVAAPFKLRHLRLRRAELLGDLQLRAPARDAELPERAARGRGRGTSPRLDPCAPDLDVP